jgi:hypothetical protein
MDLRASCEMKTRTITALEAEVQRIVAAGTSTPERRAACARTLRHLDAMIRENANEREALALARDQVERRQPAVIPSKRHAPERRTMKR